MVELYITKIWEDIFDLPNIALEISEYLVGNRKNFSFKVEQFGTKFQELVWNEIKKIPYGETLSYKEVAQNIGRPKAVRAVGTACGKNHILFAIPCHRVVSSRGIGGFGLDLGFKYELLELEKAA